MLSIRCPSNILGVLHLGGASCATRRGGRDHVTLCDRVDKRVVAKLTKPHGAQATFRFLHLAAALYHCFMCTTRGS